MVGIRSPKGSAHLTETLFEWEDTDESHSVSTILSAITDDDCDGYDSDAPSTPTSLLQLLVHQQKEFDRRDRLLERISRRKSPRFLAMIRKREALVRRLEREILMLNEVDFENTTEPEILFQDDSAGSETTIVWHDALDMPPPLETSECRSQHDSTSFHSWMYELAMMEWHITAPALMSLCIHSVAHISMYDIVDVLAEEFKKKYLRQQHNILLDNSILLFLGMLLVRWSGYLYWWLNDNDFSCIKLELHNRLKLGFWDAQSMLWIKRRPFFQAMSYFLGYNLCYKVAYDVYCLFYYSFFSLDEEEDSSPEEYEGEASCGKLGALFQYSPDDGICRAVDAAAIADANFLWSNVPLMSFDKFWSDGTLLRGPVHSVLFSFVAFVASCMMLSYYGFRFFKKY
jgi:hypothetical protein